MFKMQTHVAERLASESGLPVSLIKYRARIGYPNHRITERTYPTIKQVKNDKSGR
jgi:hypothetical protein